ncbi:MAG: PAS domain-containing protein [Myxococcales bacterium]|nr:PAS domain-containing protein [Myxococcales bacterium]
MSRLGALRWSRLSLRRRLELIMFGVIVLILGGQTVASLSKEVTRVDEHIATQGTIVAQSVAAACAEILRGKDKHRFDPLIERVRHRLDLVSLAVLSHDGRVVAHSDKSRIGHVRGRPRSVGLVRAPPSLFSLLSGPAIYRSRAPIVRGSEPLGTVELTFRSHELSRRIRAQLLVVGSMGLFWLVFGLLVAAAFVRRITRPLGELTQVAQAVTVDRFADVDLAQPLGADEISALHGAFVKLVEDVRAARLRNQALVAELESVNAGLRERVYEVTADLRKTKEYLESVLQCMDEGVLTCDDEGEIVRANEGARRQLSGFSEPYRGDNVGRLLPDGEPLLEAVQRAIAQRASETLELTRESAGAGPPRTFVFNAYPLSSAEGDELGAVLTVVDISERRVLDAQLRRHDRLISLGTLAAGLAHELGNYMHSIGGYSSLLVDHLEGDDTVIDAKRVREDVATIHEANSRAVTLLDRFLQFARPTRATLQPTDIHAVVQEALDMVGYRLRRAKVTVDTAALEGDCGDVYVACDAQLIKQVFLNLMLNAIDAMADREGERTLRVRCDTSADTVAVELEDSGEGIAPEHLERIFDPFFTTKEATGTGLGLSISHQIVAMHGGKLSVRSERGRGTTLRIELPRRAADADAEGEDGGRDGDNG